MSLQKKLKPVAFLYNINFVHTHNTMDQKIQLLHENREKRGEKRGIKKWSSKQRLDFIDDMY
jgi:hypothetical protein